MPDPTAVPKKEEEIESKRRTTSVERQANVKSSVDEQFKEDILPLVTTDSKTKSEHNDNQSQRFDYYKIRSSKT